MNEKKKQYFESMTSEMNVTRKSLSELQKEMEDFKKELSYVDDKIYNELLSERIRCTPKLPCTKENWEKMFDDISELAYWIEQAKFPQTLHHKWDGFYTAFCVEKSALSYSRIQPNSPIKLNFGSYNVQSQFHQMALYTDDRGIGAVIMRHRPYEVIEEGTPIADFDKNAFVTHLIENWDAIYSQAEEHIESFIRMEMGKLFEEEIELKKQINSCKRTLEQHFPEKEDYDRE